MTVHVGWSLVCRLFSGGMPILRSALSTSEVAALPLLNRALKPAVLDQRYVLCPFCGECRTQVWGDGKGGRLCHCPQCGPVDVMVEDVAALALDEGWLTRNLRLALDIQSRDGVDELTGDVWRLGDARRSPVVLSRSLLSIWQRPDVLDRVRVAGQAVRLITPVRRDVQGAPLGYNVDWLPLEERFALYGGGITTVGIGAEASSTHLAEPVAPCDPTDPVHGQFSEDFRWVTVPEIQAGPIKLTPMQAAIFKALWSFKGRPSHGQQVMARAGTKSTKPGDLFKDPRYQLARQAFEALVAIEKSEGMYWLRCVKQ